MPLVFNCLSRRRRAPEPFSRLTILTVGFAISLMVRIFLGLPWRTMKPSSQWAKVTTIQSMSPRLCFKSGSSQAPRVLFGQMDARHVNFAALERVERDAAAHQTRHQVLLIVFSHMLAGQKHCRIAPADNDLSAHRFAVLEQFNFDPRLFGIRLDDKTVCCSALDCRVRRGR